MCVCSIVDVRVFFFSSYLRFNCLVYECFCFCYLVVFFFLLRCFREVNSTMMDLSTEERQGEGVAHALGVVKAYHMGDYCTFFRLYFDAPSMSS